MTATLDPCLASLVSRLRAMRDRYTDTEDDDRGVPRAVFDHVIEMVPVAADAFAPVLDQINGTDTPVGAFSIVLAIVAEMDSIKHGDSLQWSMLRDNIVDIMLRAATLEAEANRE